jgi:hypothetical protein
MGIPEGAVTKPPRVLFISLWRLLIFGIVKTSHYLQQWSLVSNFIKDKDLTPDHADHRSSRPPGTLPAHKPPDKNSVWLNKAIFPGHPHYL